MNPWQERDSVIIMDNCHIYKHPDILTMITEQYVTTVCDSYHNLHCCSSMCYEFLPLYLPDYNPNEEAFSAIKAHICCTGDLACVAMTSAYRGTDGNELYVRLSETVWSVTPEAVQGWFHHCSY